jgi:hypothetical protein
VVEGVVAVAAVRQHHELTETWADVSDFELLVISGTADQQGAHGGSPLPGDPMIASRRV